MLQIPASCEAVMGTQADQKIELVDNLVLVAIPRHWFLSDRWYLSAANSEVVLVNGLASCFLDICLCIMWLITFWKSSLL